MFYVHRSSCKMSVTLARFQSNVIFLDRFWNNRKISNFMKIRPVGAELFPAYRRTDGQTDMTKLIFAFLNVSNMPRNTVRVYR